MKIFSFFILLLIAANVYGQPVYHEKYLEFQSANNQYGLVDINGIIKLDSCASLSVYENYLVVSKNKQYIIYNWNFVPIFKSDFYPESVDLKRKKILIYDNANKKKGVVDFNHQYILPLAFDDINIIDGGYIIEEHKKLGIASINGTIMIQPQYTTIHPKSSIIKNEIYVSDSMGKSGYVTKQNKWLDNKLSMPPIEWHGNVGILANPERYIYYLVNKKLDTLDGPYKHIIFRKNAKGGFFTCSNFKFEDIIVYNATAEKKYNYTAVDYRSPDNFFPVVTKDNLFGFIDANGNEILKPQYKGAHGFSEGLAPVLIDGFWKFINIKNEIVIDKDFVGEMGMFQNGMAQYFKGPTSKYGYSWQTNGLIDKQGNIVALPVFSEIEHIGNNKAIIIDKEGKFIYDLLLKKKIFRLGQDDRVFSVEG